MARPTRSNQAPLHTRISTVPSRRPNSTGAVDGGAVAAGAAACPPPDRTRPALAARRYRYGWASTPASTRTGCPRRGSARSCAGPDPPAVPTTGSGIRLRDESDTHYL
ncbi:unnamed protein product [Acanthoscelides obtectus]|uniref:Uncharacterized protein n=1 Tax=Acanthoscelides obtectus TaxID=200917 RepID=A0A9P0M6M7_ACAOB|nr:unnamed protein product [Acanthoscelides obtectus]CAK1630320.1 hypothetical protein AOBTE_LOCUS6260 [Acanthoscelides obtectus]